MKSHSKAKIFTVICSLLILASCQNYQKTKTTPEQPEVVQKASSFETYTADEFFKTTYVFGSSINHDATAALITNDDTGIFNAYRVPLDGSHSIQLTHSITDSTYAVSWFPMDDRLLFQSDKGGNEDTHLYVQELDGLARDLTPGENLKASFSGWNKDDKHFYISTNERDAKYFDLYIQLMIIRVN